ncbi:hypothetical protein BST61_g4691 [Cercospora zeina]
MAEHRISTVVRGPPPQAGRRSKYTTSACLDCSQRKVRCSGDQPCSNCVARGTTCNFVPRRERGRKGAHAKYVRTFLQHGHNADSNRAERSSRIDTLPPSNHRNIAPLDGRNAEQGERNQDSQIFMTQTGRNNRISQSCVLSTSADLTIQDTRSSPHAETKTSEEGIDTFDLQPQAGSSISLSSQLSQLMGLSGSLASKTSCLLPSPDKVRPAAPVLSLQLPNFEVLQDRVEVFFKEMNPMRPVLNQSEIVPRIAQTLKALGYNEQTGMISSRIDDAIFLGVMFFIVAIADTETPEPRVGVAKSGWNCFQQGERLAKYFAATDSPGDMDRICYYTLGAVYLFRLELLSHASGYITQAWNAATVQGLNDQSSWPRACCSTNLTRQKLWWTIYCIDIHVSRRRGKPYLIRESEVAVAEFMPELSLVSKHAGREVTTVYEHFLSFGDCSVREMEYFQTSVNLCRVWKQIWDALFSAKFGRYVEPQDVELLDARILHLERLTPPSLKWKSLEALGQQNLRNSEILDRQRLCCQLEFNLYRMIIRQNPTRGMKASPYDRRICAALAKDSTSICAAYIAAYPGVRRPAANILTLHLSETLCHLVYIVHDPDSGVEHSTLTDSFKMAHELLKKLATGFYGARKALSSIAASLCALKCTVTTSSTLGHLVDFVSREQEAFRKANSEGEMMNAEPQDKTSAGTAQSSNTIPASLFGNGDAALEMDLEQCLVHADPFFQWPGTDNYKRLHTYSVTD